MRILSFSSLFPNQVDPAHGIFVYRRTSSLSRRPGVETEVIAPVPFSPAWSKNPRWRKFSRIPRAELEGELRVHHPRYPLLPGISMPMHGALMALGAQKLARRLHKEKPFDCIDAHYVYPDGFAAVLLGKLLRVPVVVWALGTDINLFSTFPTIRPLIRWTLRHAAGIAAVSYPLQRRMVELGVDESKIRFIGNGVDTHLFHLADRTTARRSLGIAEDGKVMLTVAALREAKGHRHVIGALAKIAGQRPDVKLYLVGEGEDRRKIEELVREHGLQDRVILAGNRRNQEVALWFNAADVSILASSREGWPNVVLESLACGTPVIATPVGQVPEILKSGELGILSEQDPDALASAMDRALDGKWDRETLQRFAHSRPWSEVAKEIEQHLSQIIGGNGAKTGKAEKRVRVPG